MSPLEIDALAPFVILLGGGLVCLTLEAAGTPLGSRKRGPRTHLALIAVSACAAAALQIGLSWPEVGTPPVFGVLAADRLGYAGAQCILALLALSLVASIPSLREFDTSGHEDSSGEERGDIYALLLFAGAGLLGLVMARDLLLVATSLTLFSVSLAGVLVVDRRGPRGAEAGVKLVQQSGVFLATFGFGAAVVWGLTGQTALDVVGPLAVTGTPEALLATGLVAVPLLALLPVVPLHAVRVDVVQGAPSFAAALLTSSGLITGAVLAVRILVPVAGQARALGSFLELVAAVSLAVPALAALDQRNIDRMCSHLAAAQAGVVILPGALVTAGHTERAGLLLMCAAGGAFAVVGISVALGFVERRRGLSFTWEMWSGLGRSHPVFALGLLWLLGSLAGFPGTAGFAARFGTARAAFEDGHLFIGFLAALAPALAAIPVLRLGIFFFAKTPSSRTLQPKTQPWRVFVVSVACLGVLALGVAPEPLWARFLAELYLLPAATP